MVFPIMLCGCLLLNDVVPYSDVRDLKPSKGRAIVVIGIGLEGAWEYPKINLYFDEYDIKLQKGTGDCWRYNRIVASVPVDKDKVQYVVYDVLPGFYEFKGETSLKEKHHAFLVPAEQVVYFGDFIESKQYAVDVRWNVVAATSELRRKYPDFKGNIVVAESLPVVPSGMILCMP